VEFLHSKNILYRDLKPDNILLGQNGNVKLTDFGLSKINVDNHYNSNSFCGTHAYLAPEMFLKTGYGKSVDWYTVGAAFYEFLVGVPPFYSEDLEQLHFNIQQGPIQLPRSLSDDSKDLIIRLMYRNPTLRLGANGSEEIKSHPFFNGVDWNAFKMKTADGEFDNERAGWPMP
jgi:serine/threonine protein kinase